MSSYFGRRRFTQSLALGSLLFPWLGHAPVARAQAGRKRAKYLLVFFTNGTDTGLWSPRGSTDSRIAHSDMTEPLAPLNENLVLIEKLSSMGTSDNHAAPGGLTGLGYSGNTHISLDQFVSDQLKAQNVSTSIASLMLGGVPTEQQTTFYRNGQKLSPIFSPLSAYETIFANAAPSNPGAGSDLIRRRKSMLDHLSRELSALSAQLGASQRQKLELHAESLRQIERRLSGDGQGGGEAECRTPDVPVVSQDLLNSALHLDLAVEALSCDITRVASVQFGNHQSTQVDIDDVGPAGDWHNSFIHGDNPRTRLTNLERWLCEQFVRAANRLQERPAPDGQGTMFDQTLMIWARDMGDAVGHNGNDMRFVFSGGAGGYLKTSPDGRYIDGSGDAHQQALITACHAMGIDDFTGFGDPAAPRTPLAAIGG